MASDLSVLSGRRAETSASRRRPLTARLAPYAFCLPAIVAVTGLVLFPIGQVIVESFYDVNPTDHPGWRFKGLGNYSKAVGDGQVRAVLLRSLTWTVGSVVLQFAVALAAALLVREVFGRTWLRAIFVIPWATPVVVGALAWKLLYHPDYGLVNQLLSWIGLRDLQHAWLSDPHVAMGAVIVANVWRGFPFLMVMLLAGMAAIPDELYEAANVDGANVVRRHLFITLPMLRPVILMSTLMALIWTFNNFSLIYVMTGGGPAGSTDILTTFVYKSAFSDFNFGYASALSVVLFAILAAGSALYIKAFGKEGLQ